MAVAMSTIDGLTEGMKETETGVTITVPVKDGYIIKQKPRTMELLHRKTPTKLHHKNLYYNLIAGMDQHNPIIRTTHFEYYL